MTDSLEKKIVRFLTRPAIYATSKLAKYFYRMETPGMAEYFSPDQRKKPAVFVMKHQHMVDYVASLYPFMQVAKRQPTIPIKESLFRNTLLAAFLEEAGATPIVRPKDRGYNANSAEANRRNKEMIRNLKSGGWYAYCPEGTRKFGIVGLIDPEYLKPMLLASRLGVDIYVVGAKYTRILPVSPWIPFLTKITVRFEKYDPNGKSADQVAVDVRDALARLSGLEGKLEIGQPPAAVASATNKSTAGYN